MKTTTKFLVAALALSVVSFLQLGTAANFDWAASTMNFDWAGFSVMNFDWAMSTMNFDWAMGTDNFDWAAVGADALHSGHA